jgi:hypothetical protein
VFASLDALWGHHTINRFATIESCQRLQGQFAGRFCSLFFHPATLILLEDQSAAWWPTLRSGQGWARDIRATRTLGPVSRVILHLSASHEGVTGDPLVLALRFDGRESTLPH